MLVVDDDQAVREAIVALLQAEDYEAVAVPDGDTALGMIAPHWWPDLILVGASDAAAAAFAEEYRSLPGAHAPVVLLTDAPAVEAAERAGQLGAAGFLRKPVDGDAVTTMVRRALPPPPASEGEPRGGAP